MAAGGPFVHVACTPLSGLRWLIDEVLGTASYQERALEMKAAIAAVDGLRMAAELIERALN